MLNYFPRYKSGRPERREHFSCVKMMLHHPVRSMQDLLSVNDNVHATFASAYQVWRKTHSHPDDFYGEDIVGSCRSAQS